MKVSAVEVALGKLDVAGVCHAIGSGALSSADAIEFLNCIRRSGCMVVEWHDAEREASRDAVASKCRDLLSASADPNTVAGFDKHLAAARIVERAFRSVENTVAAHPVSKRSPAQQAWAVMKWLEEGMEFFEQQVQAEIAANPSLRDITELRLKSEDGESVSPDAVVNGVIPSAGNTLLMLAHRHRMFAADGSLLLPPTPEPALDKTAIEEGGALIFLSGAWTQVRRGWERVRFLNAEVRCEPRDIAMSEGGMRRMDVVEFSKPETVELLDRIAVDRLNERLLVNQIDIATQTNALDVVKFPAKGPVALPPKGWISLEELNASHSLATHYFVPIESDDEEALGLPLKVWLRGYAIYARCLARDSHDRATLRIISYSESELSERLTSGGLTEKQAALFVKHTTFGRGSKDLFDTPLIRTADDRFLFFAPAYVSPNPGAVLVSRLGRLGVRFQDKGKRFELATLKLFENAGIEARSFKYKADGKTWDCDVAVLWEDTLVVFECKNYGLPDGHIPSLNHFLLQLTGHIEQAARIARQLDENPQIVRQHFGSTASWNRVVACVLHALPWSAGKLAEVYCYDASALGKFLEDGFIAVKMTKKVAPKSYITRRHKFALWRGDKPSVDDLLRELQRPAQLRLGLEQSEITAQLTPLSGEMAVAVPEWTPRELSLKEKFRIFGAGEEEAKALVHQFEEFPSAVEEARQRATESE